LINTKLFFSKTTWRINKTSVCRLVGVASKSAKLIEIVIKGCT